MAAQLRQLRQQIKTVKSTAKITRAQEMIATSRIVKAQQAVAASKPYADQITQALTALVSHHVGIDHPLLQEQPSALVDEGYGGDAAGHPTILTDRSGRPARGPH